jgi:hypothetical protein
LTEQNCGGKRAIFNEQSDETSFQEGVTEQLTGKMLDEKGYFSG